MTTPENIEEAIEQTALGPKRVQVGNQSVDTHAIKDLIDADDFSKAQTAKTRKHLGLRFRKLRPGGAG